MRPQMVVGRRDDLRLDARPLAQLARDLRERRAVPKPLRSHEMEAEVEVAEPEPVLAAPPARRRERVPALAGAAPAALVVDEACERVEQRVEVGRDVQPEDLEVVADVADDGQLTGREDVRETSREAGAAASAREQDDLHAVTARSERVRGPRSAAWRSRSAAVSTSAASSGIATGANPSSRKRAALPGP